MLHRVLIMALLIYGALLLYGTHKPVESGDGVSHDKLLHFGAYLGLALLGGVALRLPRRPVYVWLLTLVVILGFAALDEFSQGWVRGRTPDRWDWVADSVGAGVGLSVLAVGAGWRRQSGTPSDG